jgi:hypothetical protein
VVLMLVQENGNLGVLRSISPVEVE